MATYKAQLVMLKQGSKLYLSNIYKALLSL